MAVVASTIYDFYMHKSALSYILNMNGVPDDISISVCAGAQILAYRKGVIDYDETLNYRKWTLLAFPTHFDDHVERYVHIALSKNGTTALVVFPEYRLDLFGRKITDDEKYFIGQPIPSENSGDGEEGTEFVEPEPNPDNYFIFIGKLSNSGTDGTTIRTWKSGPYTGELSTDKNNDEKNDITLEKMFSLDQLGEHIIQNIPFIKILLGRNDEDKKEITDIQRSSDNIGPSDTIIPTTKYADQEYLSKTKTDSQSVSSDVSFEKDIEVIGKVSSGGNISSGGDITSKGNITSGGNVGSQSFNTGILGNGWRVSNDGNGEFDSLSIRKFLEVPELRYNKISVKTGVQWQTFGAGLIDEVKQLTATKGIIKLKLEEGEYGAIAVNDLCMGIFHNDGDTSQNATVNSDERNGNFAFKGFMTVYFRIVAICNAEGDTTEPDSRNQYFVYELREVTESWSSICHPQPSMSFACYANPTNSERQACEYSTTEYSVYLAGMRDWTYGSKNIIMIQGRLDGFSIDYTYEDNGEEKQGVKTLEGYGIAFGNLYQWGREDHFTRDPLLVRQQLYYLITNDSLNDIKDNENWQTYYAWSIDAVKPRYNAKYLYQYWRYYYDNGTSTVSRPFFVSEYAGGEPFMEIGISGDTLLALGESKDITFRITDLVGNNYTKEVWKWKIERTGGSSAEADLSWGARQKSKDFANQSRVSMASISLTWSSDPMLNDLDPDVSVQSTTFRITAYMGDEEIQETIEI